MLGREEASAIIFSTRYAMYYQVDSETCIVFRVLDCRQEPEKTTKALR
jgi:hypothetical protein